MLPCGGKAFLFVFRPPALVRFSTCPLEIHTSTHQLRASGRSTATKNRYYNVVASAFLRDHALLYLPQPTDLSTSLHHNDFECQADSGERNTLWGRVGCGVGDA